MKAAIEVLIKRVEQKAANPAGQFPKITKADLPTLSEAAR